MTLEKVPAHSEGHLRRRTSSIILALLLSGSLFPPIGTVPLNFIAAVVAVPIILWEFLRSLPLLNPVIPFTLWIFGPLVISALVNDPPITSYGQEKIASLVSSTLITTLGVALLRDRETVRTFARAWVVIGLILAIATLGGANVADRAVGFGSNPIWLARAMALSVIAAAWLLWQRRLAWLIAIPAGVLMVVAVFVTGSRGPTLGMIAGFAAMTIFASTARLARFIAVLCLATLALGFAAILPSLTNLRALAFFVFAARQWKRRPSQGQNVGSHPRHYIGQPVGCRVRKLGSRDSLALQSVPTQHIPRGLRRMRGDHRIPACCNLSVDHRETSSRVEDRPHSGARAGDPYRRDCSGITIWRHQCPHLFRDADDGFRHLGLVG